MSQSDSRIDPPISIYPPAAILRDHVEFRAVYGLSRRAEFAAPTALGCPTYWLGRRKPFSTLKKHPRAAHAPDGTRNRLARHYATRCVPPIREKMAYQAAGAAKGRRRAPHSGARTRPYWKAYPYIPQRGGNTPRISHRRRSLHGRRIRKQLPTPLSSSDFERR